jgi:hypothetical protein
MIVNKVCLTRFDPTLSDGRSVAVWWSERASGAPRTPHYRDAKRLCTSPRASDHHTATDRWPRQSPDLRHALTRPSPTVPPAPQVISIPRKPSVNPLSNRPRKWQRKDPPNPPPPWHDTKDQLHSRRTLPALAIVNDLYRLLIRSQRNPGKSFVYTRSL